MKKSLLIYFVLLPMLLSCQSEKQKIRLRQDVREKLIQQIRLPHQEVQISLPPAELRETLKKSAMGAAYYYSYILEKQGFIEQALQLVISEIDEHTPFAGRAALRFINLSEKGAQHNFDLYKALLPLVKDPDENDPSLLFSIGYAAFMQKKYHETLDYLTRIDPLEIEQYTFGRPAQMIITLAQAILKLPDWEDDLTRIFLNARGDKNTIWALEWIQEQGIKLSAIPLYQAISLDAKNQSLQAYQTFKSYLSTESKEARMKQPLLWQQFANIAGRAKQRGDAVKVIGSYISDLSGETLFQAQSAMGALLFNMGNYEESLIYLKKAITYPTKGPEVDRAIWFYISALYQVGPMSRFTSEMANVAKIWNKPSYFRALFQRILNDLVSKQYFHHIYDLYRKALYQNTEPLTAVHYAWVCARALHHRMLIMPKGMNQKAVYNSLITDALAVPWSYPSIMAYTLLGETPPFYQEKDVVPLVIDGRPSNFIHTKTDATNQLYKNFSERALGPGMVNEDVYALGFLYYGLVHYPDVYPVVMRKLKHMRPILSTNALRLLGREFNRMEMPAESISMAIVTMSRPNFEPTKEDYKAIYPRGYRKVLEEAAKEHNLPAYLLYGLVWNESLFQKDVVSRANAVGLGQLLAPTAKEMAQRIRMGNFSLTDPQDNLILTSVYFNWLKGQFDDNIVYVLMAYNAGIGNVRKWVREFGHFPAEIFVESSPFGDTRSYVRDITADSAVYGYLYFNIPPSQTVNMIFRKIQGEKKR